jgi:peptide/nickel transport system substrate-binding protein
MTSNSRWAAPVAALLFGIVATSAASEPKHGGILKMEHRGGIASASILEEATFSTVVPFMGIFNNLVMYKQDVAQNSMDDIVPDLATSWAWSPDRTKLTFELRKGVKWHDGVPFTAKDVQCTFYLVMGRSQDKLRKNPRKSWYQNVSDVVTNGDYEVSFILKRPQPALITLLASGYSAIYPCHVSAAQMRTHPIGTGPFKFVEYKTNQSIKVVRNPDYWKKGRPYLDGIDYTIIHDVSTSILAFVAGKYDMTFPTNLTVAEVKDLKKQDPQAVCKVEPDNVNTNLIVNRDAAPFNNPDIRKAMALALDRKAFVDILFEGQADIGGAMLPPPQGMWGLTPAILKTIPGYGPDVAKNRAEARKLMEKAGYGPNHHLEIKVSTRNLPVYRDPAVILIDQLKQVYIDAELDVVETAQWFPKIARKDYAVGLNLTGNAVDDPDQAFYENYACGSQRNYTGYCNPDLQKLFDQQSMETDRAKREKIVWEIDKKLQEDVARPIIFHARQGTCWQPYVKGITVMVNSTYNGYRYEDVWLDK